MKPGEKQKKTSPAPVKQYKKAPAKVSGTATARPGAILYNIVGALAAGILLAVLFQHHEPDPANPGETHLNSGYDWMLNTMLAGNLKTIEDNPGKTIQQRYELKWGQGEITYTNRIRSSTPDSAIILMPPKKALTGLGIKSMVDLPWLTYFLYPRMVAYSDSVESPLAGKATYLVSVNGWGLDKVGYTVEKPEPFMILPIKK